MATIYFNKALVSTALELLKPKGTVDKLKAKDDIDQIELILTSYCNGYGYDPVTANQLDTRISREYPIIESIRHLSPSKEAWVPRNNPTSEIDPVINNLNQDRYGIMFDILFKEGLVHELEDFVERIE